MFQLTSDAETTQGRERSNTNSTSTDSLSTDDDKTDLHKYSGRPKSTIKGTSLTFQQLGALLTKRVFHFVRNWRMLFSTLLLPLIAFACAMGFATLRPGGETMRPLIMTPAIYSDHDPSYAFFK